MPTETVHIDLAGPYVHERVHSYYHVSRQRLEVVAAIRHHEEVGDHHVRANTPRQHERHEATALLPDGQRWVSSLVAASLNSVSRLFPDVDLGRISNIGPDGNLLWC